MERRLRESKHFSLFIPVSKFEFPILTDHYYVLDLLYYLLSDGIRSGLIGNKHFLFISDDTIEYLDSILEEEDKDFVWEISEYIMKKILKISQREEFAFLSDCSEEILNVQYRYVREEKYVRFLIEFE